MATVTTITARFVGFRGTFTDLMVPDHMAGPVYTISAAVVLPAALSSFATFRELFTATAAMAIIDTGSAFLPLVPCALLVITCNDASFVVGISCLPNIVSNII